MHTLESHAEVITGRIQWELLILYLPCEQVRRHIRSVSPCHLFLLLIFRMSNEYIESTHTWMSVARKVQVAIGSERREHLITRSVDWRTERFGTTEPRRQNHRAPYIQSTHAAGSITHEVEPLAVRRHSRMSITRQCVLGYLAFRRTAPGSITAVRLPYFRKTGVVRV